MKWRYMRWWHTSRDLRMLQLHTAALQPRASEWGNTAPFRWHHHPNRNRGFSVNCLSCITCVFYLCFSPHIDSLVLDTKWAIKKKVNSKNRDTQKKCISVSQQKVPLSIYFLKLLIRSAKCWSGSLVEEEDGTLLISLFYVFHLIFLPVATKSMSEYHHCNSLNASGGGRKAIFKNVQVFPMWKYFYPWGMKDWWNIQSISAGSLYKQLWSTEQTSFKKNKEKRCNCHAYERNYGGT